MWLNIPQQKLGNIWVIFPNCQNHRCYKKYLKGNKHNSLPLAQRYAWIFVFRHYLFREAHRATFLEQIMSMDKYPAPSWCRRHRIHHNRTPPSQTYCFYCFPHCFVLLFPLMFYINCVFYTKKELNILAYFHYKWGLSFIYPIPVNHLKA